MFHVVLLLLTTYYVSETTGHLETHRFKTRNGYKLLNGTPLRSSTNRKVSLVMCANLCSGLCESATYSSVQNKCITFKDKIYDSTISWTSDSQWRVLYKDDLIKFGNWTMVFRAQKEINKSFYGVFLANGSNDDNPLSDEFPIECYRVDNLGNCNRHFRSRILDSWINIDKVKFAFYTEGVEMKSIVFEGKSSTWSSWFNQSAIVTSSWTNIKTDSSISHFTLPGNTAYGIERRFTIDGSYTGCTTSVTYMFTIDTNWDVCTGAWNLTISNFPLFIYAPGNTLVGLSGTPSALSGRLSVSKVTSVSTVVFLLSAYRFADVLAIFVTFTTQ